MRTRVLSPCLLLALLSACPGDDGEPEPEPQPEPQPTATGARTGPRSEIALRSIRFVPGEQDLAAIPPTLQAEAPDGVHDEIVIVQFPGPVTAADYRRLSGRAKRIYTYLPDDAYLVRMSPTGDRSVLAADLGARWIGPYHPAYKLAPAVSGLTDRRAQAAASAPLQVMVEVLPDADLDAVVSRVEALGMGSIVGHAEGSFFSRLRLLTSPADLVRRRDDLVRMPEVFWLDLEAKRALLNDTTIWVCQGGVPNPTFDTPVFDHGIYGEGQIIGVLDTGVDPDMCYFRDSSPGLPPTNLCNGGTAVDRSLRKVIAADFLWSGDCDHGVVTSYEWDSQGHGTHVSGIALGDDLAHPLVHDHGDGMAPEAKLVIQDGGFAFDNCADLPGIGCPVVDLNPIFQQAYDQGARIHTNSWGDQENTFPQNNYTVSSQDADEFMWNHKDFLLFFAAGNSGPSDGTVGSPSTAKNVISVGATQHAAAAGSMANFSSCGPTEDGRIKPDLTTPGQFIVSALSDSNAASRNCGTGTLSGTSMASPAAAGLTALIRQYYTDGWYPTGTAVAADAFTPTAALLKASLISSAAAMTNVALPPPSTCQGWGRVLLDDVLAFSGDARKLWVEDDEVGFPLGSVGEERSYQLRVTSGSEPFRATLVWTDSPSTPAALTTLVNDLDLEVTGPRGTFLGNSFASGESLPGGSPDRLNTVEQVRLPLPTAGEYTVTVRSAAVPSGPQPFALVVTGALRRP